MKCDGPSIDDVFRLVSPLVRSRACQDINQFDGRITAHQYRRAYDLCHREILPDSKVLDWGCGNGHFSFFLALCGHRVTSFSFDAKPCMFKHLDGLQTRPLVFVQGTDNEPTRLPFGNEDFDAIFSIGVLEHVAETGGDDEASLKEIRRTLKPGGLFICFHLPNEYSLIEALSRHAWSPSGHFHKHRYTAKKIKSLCAAANMHLLGCRRYGILPRNICVSFPSFVKDNAALTACFDAMDGILERIASPVAQNYCFWARK